MQTNEPPRQMAPGSVRIYRYERMEGTCEDGDWCFVRLPQRYAADGPPCPWIVCNHGNGWRMDGSERYANFSGKTQYGVDPQRDGAYLRPDLDGRRFRLYSNPTIEAFLEAGYIVCGAQNGGDLLYGNRACRLACAAFVRHMKRTYRVEERCAMLGVSNGFLTSFGAAAELGGVGAVSALIGLYPLCNLRHACEHMHRDGVKRAFGIASDDPGEFAAKAGTFDPCGDRRGSGSATAPAPQYPPTLLVWSATDQVLPMGEHAVRLAVRLRADGVDACDIRIDCDGEVCLHGDWRHFMPERFVAWCERNR
ncbi:MAG: hypothetical protein J7639_00950 [Paenibacillaceae bacterium]|nr:hypothetical protein [Paenibacillaceae bacterium]